MQLGSWIPRRPSAELKHKIFVQPEEPKPIRQRAPRPVTTWSWLAPAAACCLTLFTLFGANNFRTGDGAIRENHAIFAVAMSSLTTSNPTANLRSNWFGLSASDENLEWNIWSKTSFDWTNEGQFLSTNHSLQLARTNYLMR
jgi:hypothetical protein